MEYVFLLSSGGKEQHLTCNSCHRRRIALTPTPFPAGESCYSTFATFFTFANFVTLSVKSVSTFK